MNISDGCGNEWDDVCGQCGQPNEITGPGDVQCGCSRVKNTAMVSDQDLNLLIKLACREQRRNCADILEQEWFTDAPDKSHILDAERPDLEEIKTEWRRIIELADKGHVFKHEGIR